MKFKFSIPSLPFLQKLAPVWRYRAIVFIIFIASLSGYLVAQINSAINVAPSEEVQAATTSKTPRIDPQLVQKLKSLEDNSVTVKTLFNEARENPFQ